MAFSCDEGARFRGKTCSFQVELQASSNKYSYLNFISEDEIQGLQGLQTHQHLQQLSSQQQQQQQPVSSKQKEHNPNTESSQLLPREFSDLHSGQALTQGETTRKCNNTRRCIRKSKTIAQTILMLCEKEDQRLEQRMSREDRSRLAFLKETLDLIVKYLSEQVVQVVDLNEYNVILEALLQQLDQTHNMMNKILQKQSAITDNFDVFELTLRRYLDQLNSMFPLNDSKLEVLLQTPSELISDPLARDVWDRYATQYCFYMNFDSFLSTVVEKELLPQLSGNSSVEFVLFLRYFLNFPADDLVTTYKWNHLTRLFGPFQYFVNNFSRIALGQGFLGLINRIQAHEVLQMQFDKLCVLIRFSRTQPDFLAFSYKDSTGQIKHQINRDAQGQLIPVETFLTNTFAHFQLVRQRVNVRAILGHTLNSTLCDYADNTGGYVE